MTHRLTRLAAAAACVLCATAAAAQGPRSGSGRDLSIDCPPTAAGKASTHTPLSSRSEARTLQKDMTQCTAKRDRKARAACARDVWEDRSAAAGTQPSNQRMAMANCRA